MTFCGFWKKIFGISAILDNHGNYSKNIDDFILGLKKILDWRLITLIQAPMAKIGISVFKDE